MVNLKGIQGFCSKCGESAAVNHVGLQGRRAAPAGHAANNQSKRLKPAAIAAQLLHRK